MAKCVQEHSSGVNCLCIHEEINEKQFAILEDLKQKEESKEGDKIVIVRPTMVNKFTFDVTIFKVSFMLSQENLKRCFG